MGDGRDVILDGLAADGWIQLLLPAGASCSPSPSLGGGGAVASFDNADDWILASGSAISPPNTAQIWFGCSWSTVAGYFDQLYLSTVNLGPSPF